MIDVQKNKRNKILKIIVAVTLAILFFAFFYYAKEYFTEARIQQMLTKAGIWAPMVYILLWAILPIFLFPVPLLVVPSGYIFGTTLGVIYTLIGCAINIVIMYYLAATVARGPIVNLVEKKSNDKMKHVFFNPSKTSQGVFFIFRLIPLISYNLINYVAGILNIQFLPYFILSMVGITPGIFAFIYLGEQIHDPSSSEFKLAIFFLVLLTLLSLILLSIYNKRHEKH